MHVDPVVFSLAPEHIKWGYKPMLKPLLNQLPFNATNTIEWVFKLDLDD